MVVKSMLSIYLVAESFFKRNLIQAAFGIDVRFWTFDASPMFEYGIVEKSLAKEVAEASVRDARTICKFVRDLVEKIYFMEHPSVECVALTLLHRYGISTASAATDAVASAPQNTNGRSVSPFAEVAMPSGESVAPYSVASHTSITSVTSSPLWHVACGCLFMSCKLNETRKRVKHVANAALAVRRSVEDMESIPSGDIDALVKCILECERDVLYATGYSIGVRTCLPLFEKYFQKYVDGDEITFRRCCERVYLDALSCNVCVCFERKEVAASCLAIAAACVRRRKDLSAVTREAVSNFKKFSSEKKALWASL